MSPRRNSSSLYISSSEKIYSPAFSRDTTRRDIFFNSQVSISELKKVTEETSVDELFQTWDVTQKKIKEWVSNTSSPMVNSPVKAVNKITKFPFLLSPPPGFEKVTPIKCFSDISTESDASPSIDQRKLCTVSMNDVKLHPAPLKSSLVKREKRGTFTEENVSDERQFGEIKFYQLKKRFGFVSLDADKSDVFLCEDDLVLSGVSMKKFKEAIFKRAQIRLSFLIKFYYENSQPKRKAIDVKIETDLN